MNAASAVLPPAAEFRAPQAWQSIDFISSRQSFSPAGSLSSAQP
jgi:hypothetical protein